MKRICLYCFKILLFFVIFISCDSDPHVKPVEETRIMMDTFITITIYNDYFTEDQAHEIISKAFIAMTRIDTLANNYDDSSIVSLLNQQAHERLVQVNPDLLYLVKKSIEIADISEGAFDISISPLIKLWPFGNDNPQLPEEKNIQNTLKHVNYQEIQIEDNKIKFNNQNTEIDLGGIAKGFAVDRAMDVLVSHGVRDALINAGGDIKAICSKLTQGRRKVWIRHPRERDKLYGYFQMDDGSVATSGDYERYVEIDSVRYHHILDPKTGYPARPCISVTVKAQDATTADALATAVFVLGPEKGMRLLNKLDNVEGVILFEEESGIKFVVSEGLKDKFFKVD